MRPLFAALALAGAFSLFTPTVAAEPATHLAQMSRDVTDAVRRQRTRTTPRTATSCRHPTNGNQQ